jgi:hypothetical protein
VDAKENVYVAGAGSGGYESGLDYTTIKYDAFGNELWIKTHNGTGSVMTSRFPLPLMR